MKYQMERSYSKRKENRVHHAVRRDVLTNKIMHAMATGNWTGGAQEFTIVRQDV